MASKEKQGYFPPLNPQDESTVQPRQPGRPQQRRGWEQEWIPVADEELKTLVDREDPVRQLTNHNTLGLKTIYFTREKQVNIGLVRSMIKRQLKLGRVIRALNFVGDEVLKTEKHEKAIIAANEALRLVN